MANIRAYYDLAKITTLKSFIVQAPRISNLSSSQHDWVSLAFPQKQLQFCRSSVMGHSQRDNTLKQHFP